MKRAAFWAGIAILILAAHSIFADESGAFFGQPNLDGRLSEALSESEFDRLRPHITRDGTQLFSHHLNSVSCLGTIARESEKFYLATVLFLRSSAKVSEYAPARGHGSLLCLTTDSQLIGHCRLDFPEVTLWETTLFRSEDVVADFSTSDEATKQRGFPIDGSDFLPYPFADVR